MKIDKQTLMLFGGGLLVGYLICKFMSKSDAPVQFGADGLLREPIGNKKPNIGATPMGSSGTFTTLGGINPINSGYPQPIPMGGTDPIGSTGNLLISRRRN
jgi:hypothetical protein